MNHDFAFSGSSWDSLPDFLKHYLFNYEEICFKSSPSLSPVMNHALQNMHLNPCNDYVCKRLTSEQLGLIINKYGLPTPFILELYQNQLCERLKNSVSVGGQIYLADYRFLTDWVNRNLSIVHDSFQPFSLEDINYRIVEHDQHSPQFTHVCATPDECDAIEFNALLSGVSVKRVDNFSVLDDPIIHRLINLYLYLNNRSHLVFLHNVVQSCITGFASTEKILFYSNLLLSGEQHQPLPDSLIAVRSLCHSYKQGVSSESLFTFVEQLTDLSHGTDQSRLDKIKMTLNCYERCGFQPNSFKQITLLNCLLSPRVKSYQTLISNNVQREYLQIKGSIIHLFDFNIREIFSNV